MEPSLYILLALAGLLAGFFDSIIGGGGIVTLPTLLAVGLPPHMAVATNKVAGIGASSVATYNYWRAGLIRARIARVLLPLAFAGSIAGAALLLRIPERYILASVMALMVVLTAYVLLRPSFGQHVREPTSRAVAGLLAMALVVGFYDGILGPGTGNLLLFGFVMAGFGLLQAAAHGRAVNFASNAGALLFFVFWGDIAWDAGLALAVGTVTGGWLGSRSNIRTGARWVRPLFVVVAAVLFLRLMG